MAKTATEKLIPPLPWRAAGRLIHDANGLAIGSFNAEEAEFISRACNAHDELLAALKDLRDLCAAAFRVIDAHHREFEGGECVPLHDELVAEVDRAGQHVIGAGARADAAIAKAEGR